MHTNSQVFPSEAYAWLGDQLGVKAHHIIMTRMQGSTSSSIFRVASVRDPATPRGVLRVLDNKAWLDIEADLAEHEAAALLAAAQAGLPAPRLIGFASYDAGFGAPVVLMTHIPGKVQLQPACMDIWLKRLAAQLAGIHQYQAPRLNWRYRSWLDRRYLGVPAWAKQPYLWEKALRLLQAGEPAAYQVFIHRDYHPANVLWQSDQISGVVDWINACRGPAGVDLAHCRINLALMYGYEVAERFLKFYEERVPGFTYQPYWDIEAILGSCLPKLSYYAPWQEFGLPLIPMAVLRQRVEQHLTQVLQHG
ncbi:MAG: aminoglycoside phosphotransferase family protein [Limnochordia bacterium]